MSSQKLLLLSIRLSLQLPLGCLQLGDGLCGLTIPPAQLLIQGLHQTHFLLQAGQVILPASTGEVFRDPELHNLMTHESP